MSYTTTFKKFLKESREPEDNSRLVDDADDDFPLELDDIEEMSTSAGAGEYETPNAFGELGDDTIEMLGYKKGKKVKKEVKKPVKESEFMKLSKELYLNEISYNEYTKFISINQTF
jgi:hypothetical protein